jgi:hypothetical protein
VTSIRRCHPRGGRSDHRRRFLQRRVRFGHSSSPARLGGADERLSWVHAVARGVSARHGGRADRRRPRRRRDAAEAAREVILGLRWRGASPGRNDLEGGGAGEEEHRPSHPGDRRDRAAAGSRGRDCEQAVLRRPRPAGGRSFARKYVEFATTGIELALLARRALAKDAGVSPDGSGSHRIVISSDAGSFTDPDGFAWEAAGTRDERHTADATAQAT